MNVFEQTTRRMKGSERSTSNVQLAAFISAAFISGRRRRISAHQATSVSATPGCETCELTRRFQCMSKQFVLAEGIVELSRNAKHTPGMGGPWHYWHFDAVFFQEQVLNRIDVER